jgi:hypothetical protein
VLAAVSIPLVIAAKKNLKYTELCDTAREIYISVQNKLVGEKATGQLTALPEHSLQGILPFHHHGQPHR